MQKTTKQEKIVIVSNRKCEVAIHLYKKFDFKEIPVDTERFPFNRADTVFEQELHLIWLVYTERIKIFPLQE